jgi:hypothetical protein
MRTLPLSLLLLAACSDAGLTKHNAIPTVEISSHVDGDTVREGFPESLRGVVGDADHDLTELVVTWRVDGTTACEGAAPDSTGLVTCDTAFAAGGGSVILEVRDPDGGSDSARVTLDVQPTDAPVAELTAPVAEGTYYSDRLITFAGTASDAEDPAEALTVRWETSALGDLGLTSTITSAGAVEAFGNLPEGEHALSMVVTDTTGRIARDSVIVRVGPPNSAPTCAITAPTDGAAARSAETIRFEGTVGDVDVPAERLSVAWSSDRDGAFGSSTPDTDGTVRLPYGALTVGTHLVTLAVSDDVGARCTDSIYVTVGTPPVLVVDSPGGGDVVNLGEGMLFSATVSDAEDIPSDLALTWVSDVDGVLWTGMADAMGASRFSSTTLSAGPHVIAVTVTDTDGLSASALVDITVNETPTAPTVTIAPDPAVTTDDLLATASGSVDPDGSGAITYAYTWYEDGVRIGASTTDTLPASATTKHRTYRVEVTPNDGTGDGDVGWAERTVDNSAPVLSGPTLSTATPHIGDTLTCAAAASDADADSVSVTYAWSDGSSGTTLRVTTAYRAGDVITCTATADDGDGGVTVASASATVVNADPVVSSVAITPSSPRTNDTLTASASTSDPDGDPLTVTYDWSVDGSVVASGSSATLAGATWFSKGQVVAVTVTATDGSASASATSASVTVENTPPGAPVVAISPTSPVEAVDALRCLVTTASSDADADPVTYSASWTVDGVAYTATTSTTFAGDTIPASATAAGDVWTCTVTPDDGDDTGTTASASVTVRSASTDYVLFVTDQFIDGSRSLSSRSAADAYCASYAAANGIRGSDFRIVYSTPSENARDYLPYDSTAGDRVYDRYGTRIDGGDLWGSSRVTLTDMKSWTITSTGNDGRFTSCSGSYPSGSWPICQYCSQKFACGSSSDDPFAPGSCCWTGTRAVVCMGAR